MFHNIGTRIYCCLYTDSFNFELDLWEGVKFFVNIGLCLHQYFWEESLLLKRVFRRLPAFFWARITLAKSCRAELPWFSLIFSGLLKEHKHNCREDQPTVECAASKKDCALKKPTSKEGLLHRFFSTIGLKQHPKKPTEEAASRLAGQHAVTWSAPTYQWAVSRRKAVRSRNNMKEQTHFLACLAPSALRNSICWFAGFFFWVFWHCIFHSHWQVAAREGVKLPQHRNSFTHDSLISEDFNTFFLWMCKWKTDSPSISRVIAGPTRLNSI